MIAYTTLDSPLGHVLVAATERGVCFVGLGDTAQEVQAALRREFPAVRLQQEDGLLRRWAGPVLACLNGQGPAPDVPLDVRGTAFQQRVWDHLRTIPAGTTRSYGEIAARLGFPRGARAVARACATNPVPVIVPCHRVVRGDGGAGGYRWGLNRKRALLAQERATANA